MLVEAVLATTTLCLEFVTERSGAVGDAYVSTSIIAAISGLELELTQSRFHGARQPFEGTHHVAGSHISRALISLEDALTAHGRVIIARMQLAEIFQWFGFSRRAADHRSWQAAPPLHRAPEPTPSRGMGNGQWRRAGRHDDRRGAVTQKTYRFHIDELALLEKGMGDVISRDHLGIPTIVRIEIVHADDGWEVTLVLDVD
jgi:hypothetical protein